MSHSYKWHLQEGVSEKKNEIFPLKMKTDSTKGGRREFTRTMAGRNGFRTRISMRRHFEAWW